MVDDDPLDDAIRAAFASAAGSDAALGDVVAGAVARRRRRIGAIAAALLIVVLAVAGITAAAASGGHKTGVAVSPDDSTTVPAATTSSISAPSMTTPGPTSATTGSIPAPPNTAPAPTDSTVPPTPLIGSHYLVVDIQLSSDRVILGGSVAFTATISNPNDRPVTYDAGQYACIVVHNTDVIDVSLNTGTCVSPHTGFQAAPGEEYNPFVARVFAPHESVTWSGSFVVSALVPDQGGVDPGPAAVTIEDSEHDSPEVAGTFGGTAASLLILPDATPSTTSTTAVAPTTTTTSP